VTLVKHGFTVVPVYKEVFPDLSFMNRVVSAYEEYFKTPIWKIPHRSIFLGLLAKYGNPEFMNRANFDKMTEFASTEAAQVRDRRYAVEYMLKEHNCDICVVGTKASDNLSRRVNFQVGGPFNANEMTFALTWRLKKNAPFDIMLKDGMPIPGFYLWLGRSPEFTFDAEYWFIRKYYPSDYAIIKAMLPNIDVRVKTFEMNIKPRLLLPVKAMLQAKKDGRTFIM